MIIQPAYVHVASTQIHRIIQIIPDQVLAHLAYWNTSARNRKQDNIKESTWSLFLEGRAECQNVVYNHYS